MGQQGSSQARWDRAGQAAERSRRGAEEQILVWKCLGAAWNLGCALPHPSIRPFIPSPHTLSLAQLHKCVHTSLAAFTG